MYEYLFDILRYKWITLSSMSSYKCTMKYVLDAWMNPTRQYISLNNHAMGNSFLNQEIRHNIPHQIFTVQSGSQEIIHMSRIKDFLMLKRFFFPGRFWYSREFHGILWKNLWISLNILHDGVHLHNCIYTQIQESTIPLIYPRKMTTWPMQKALREKRRFTYHIS